MESASGLIGTTDVVLAVAGLALSASVVLGAGGPLSAAAGDEAGDVALTFGARVLAAFASSTSAVVGLVLLFLQLVRSAYRWATLIREESFTVIRGVGIQLETVFCNGKRSTVFLDRARVRDIVINEGFRRQRVVFFLAVLLKDDEDQVVVVFEHSLPRLATLLEVYDGARRMLFGRGEEDD